MPAGPEAGADTLDAFAAALDRAYNRVADWADGQPMAPASAAGISLILGICAAAWFTAGTRIGNLYGAVALVVAYLVALGSREFLLPGAASVGGLAAAGSAGAGSGGLVAGTSASRSAWLSTLGGRLSEYAVYVGLAIGAAVEGWHGTWPLTIAVLGLAAVCDTMTACSRPAWRPAAPAGQPAAVRRIPPGTEPDDTIPDVPAWDGMAPDAAPPGGLVPAGRIAVIPAYEDLPRPGGPGPAGPGAGGSTPGGAGDSRDDGAEPGHLGLGGLASRVLLTALSMPPGARVLLVAVAAPVFGAQPALVALLDWGIIAVGFGIGSRTTTRHRDRKADEHARDAGGRPAGRAESGSLAVLLLPARPAEHAGWAEECPPAAGRPLSAESLPENGVLPSAELPPSTEFAPGAELRPATEFQPGSEFQPGTEFAPGAEFTPDIPVRPEAAASLDSPAFAGEPSVGAARGVAYTGEAVAARDGAGHNEPVQYDDAPYDGVPARRLPGGPRGRFRGGREPQAGGRSLGRLLRGRGSRAGHDDRGGEPDGEAVYDDDEAVYDWAQDAWAQDDRTEDDWDAAGPPAAGTPGTGALAGTAATGRDPGASRGPATDAELADQDEWDAELEADQPGYRGTGAPDVPDERPTLAERLGLGRPRELAAGSLGPGGDPGGDPDEDADALDAGPGYTESGYAAQPTGPGRGQGPGAPADPGASGPEDAAARRAQATVLRNRDDGTLARWFGQLVRGQLMPLPPALLALAAVAMLAYLGLRDLPGLLILAPALVMLVAAPGASHQHDGRFDWLVPAVLQGAQYVYIAALGFAVGVPAPITFLLCVTVALHYADIGSAGSPVLLAARRAGSPLAVRRAADGRRAPAPPRRSFQQHLDRERPGRPRPARAKAGPRAERQQPATELGTWMGWEGRMIVVGLSAAMGVAMFAYLALAGYLGYLIWTKLRASYLGLRTGGVR